MISGKQIDNDTSNYICNDTQGQICLSKMNEPNKMKMGIAQIQVVSVIKWAFLHVALCL